MSLTGPNYVLHVSIVALFQHKLTLVDLFYFQNLGMMVFAIFCIMIDLKEDEKE